MRDALKRLRIFTGETTRISDNNDMNVEKQRNFSNDLNRFYCRFERYDLDDELNSHVADRGRG